jgi:hypothetical protein
MLRISLSNDLRTARLAVEAHVAFFSSSSSLQETWKRVGQSKLVALCVKRLLHQLWQYLEERHL